MSDFKKGFTPRMMGQENINIILQLIRSHEPVSRTELAEMTGLSKTAVSSSVDRLLEADLVMEEVDKSSQGLGRKPIALNLNPSGAYFLVLDLSGFSVRMGILNFANEVVAVKKLEQREYWSKLLDQFSEEIEELEDWAGLKCRELNAIIVAAPGVVHDDGLVKHVPNIKGMDGVSLKEQLTESVSVPVLLENDVNLAALGEYYERSSDYTNLIYVSVGQGVGAGIVLNGSLYRGSSNHAGEVGWFITSGDQFSGPNSDSIGPLEKQISILSLSQKTHDIGRQSKARQDDLYCGSDNYRKLFEMLEEGDDGENILEKWFRETALLLCNIDLLLDPDIIVLGGEVLNLGDNILDRLKELVHSRVQREPELELPKNPGMESFHGGAALCNSNMEVIERTK